jgi:hypothetical protein
MRRMRAHRLHLNYMLRKYLKLVVGVTLTGAVSGIGLAAAACDAGPRVAATPASNVWVDTNGGRCTRSAKPTSYSGAKACGSIDAAWDVCKPGDRIVVRKGSYPEQTITGDKKAPGCAVRADNGTTISGLETNGAFFSLRNITIDVGAAKLVGWKDRASNVTLRNVRLQGPFVVVDIFKASNVRWLGGELGTAGQTGGARVCGEDAQPVQVGEADHITISNVTFHPQAADLTPSCSVNGQHLEMIRLDGGTSFFTLRDSTFDSGDRSNTASIFITEPGGSADPHDLTFENNFFGTNDAAVGTFESHRNVSPCVNFTFAYNTFLTTPGAFECTSAVDVRWIGNLGPFPPGPQCFGTRIDNVWQDTNRDDCGSDRWVTGPRGHTNRLGLTADGFHLGRGSAAIDAGEVAGYCVEKLRALDHDGGRRQIGIRCDAGADEYQKGQAVVASVGAPRWSGGLLRIPLRTREPVTVAVRLLQGARTVARLTSRVPSPRRTQLELRGIHGAGSARLSIVLIDVAGNRRVVQRSVTIAGR